METTQTSVTTNGHTPPAPVAAQVEVFNAREVVSVLQGLMVKVTDQECSATNVNAACNAAARIADILRIHLEAEKMRREDDKILRAERRLQGRS